MSGEWNDYPKCPYCGAEDEDLSSLPVTLEHDGDEGVLSCGECGRDYLVTMCVSYSFCAEPWSKNNVLHSRIGELRFHEGSARRRGFFDLAVQFNHMVLQVERELAVLEREAGE